MVLDIIDCMLHFWVKFLHKSTLQAGDMPFANGIVQQKPRL